MAEISKCLIEDKIKKEVSKYEVGYMAMYFGVFISISENSYKKREIYKVAFICVSGVLTARIISSQLKKILYPESEIYMYSSSEVNTELLNKYDLICYTYKLNCDTNIPIIYIKEIFDEHQLKKIEQLKYTEKLEVSLLQGIDSILRLLDEEKFLY